MANNGQHLPTVLSCPEDEFCLGNCRKSGFSCFSNTEGLMAQCPPPHSNVKYLNPGKIYPSTFRLVRYAKMSACTYRNDPQTQKVRILGPRRPRTSGLNFSKKFFFDFLDELSNFKHFETNFFFRPFLAFIKTKRPKKGH